MLFSRVFLLTLFVSVLYCEEKSSGEEAVPQADEEVAPEAEDKGASEGSSDSDAKEDSSVLVLTSKNFDEVINDKDIILVKFYVSW